MDFSGHARKRQEQRSISDVIVNVILDNGRISHGKDGAMKAFFGKKEKNEMISELKKTIRLIERADRGVVVFNTENIITVYRKN